MSGGTTMWCKECEQLTVCKAVPAASITGDPDDYGQRKYDPNHPDVNWFQRGRICLDCESEFVTAEIHENFLIELIKLRCALRDIKINAKKYTKESTAASETLLALSKSLSVLDALNDDDE